MGCSTCAQTGGSAHELGAQDAKKLFLAKLGTKTYTKSKITTVAKGLSLTPEGKFSNCADLHPFAWNAQSLTG